MEPSSFTLAAQNRKRRGKGYIAPIPKAISTQIRQVVKSQLNQKMELKWFDSYIDASYDSTGNALSISAVSTGTGPSNRIGNTIRPTKLELTIAMDVADTYNVARILVFQWNEDSNSVLPTNAVIFDSSYLTSPGDAPYNPLNMDFRSNYTVLMDDLFVVHTYKPITVKRQTITGFKPITYNTGSSDGYNRIFMYLITDSGAVPHPSISFTARLFYYDG